MLVSAKYIKEVKRKSLHFSSLWIPCFYFVLGKEQMLWLLGIVGAGVVITDIGRHYSLYLANIFYSVFGDMLRSHEMEPTRVALTGASYLMIASFLVVLLFPKLIAVTALSVLMVSDTVAALVGKRYGKTPLVGGKTLQGTLGFIASGWLAVAMVGHLFPVGKSYYIIAGLAVCVGAVVELFSKKLRVDDNLTIPVSIGSFMWLVWYFVK